MTSWRLAGLLHGSPTPPLWWAAGAQRWESRLDPLCDGPMPLQGREVRETLGRSHLRWRQGWPRQRLPGHPAPAGVVDGLHNPTDDPEVRYTEAGIARAVFRVAVPSRREQEPSWFTLIVWGDQTKHAAQSLSKGSRVVVVGRLQQRSWIAEDGSARQVVEVVADELGPNLTGAPWWRHFSRVPANSRCRRPIASEPGLREG
jgi:Single-strand binding protein family